MNETTSVPPSPSKEEKGGGGPDRNKPTGNSSLVPELRWPSAGGGTRYALGAALLHCADPAMQRTLDSDKWPSVHRPGRRAYVWDIRKASHGRHS